MLQHHRFQRLHRAVAGDAGPYATFACLFMAALAASCLQSGLASLALVPAALSSSLLAIGLLGRLRPVMAIPVRAARRGAPRSSRP